MKAILNKILEDFWILIVLGIMVSPFIGVLLE
jgi:hypothetical protein